jgi:proline iminopeptidase
VGADVSTMTWDNLTSDADALRAELGFERWSVLGHSFGGHVALEYALRYPERLSQLVLLDTGGDSWWSLVNAGDHLARHGFSPEIADLARRFLNGRIEPREFLPDLARLGGAYNPHTTLAMLARDMLGGAWRTRARPRALMFAARHLMPGWTVMDRLPEIQAPTLVLAGRDDFIFPPEHQAELAAGIPGARLQILEGAGHNPQMEQLDALIDAIREFIRPEVPAATR